MKSWMGPDSSRFTLEMECHANVTRLNARVGQAGGESSYVFWGDLKISKV